MLAARQAATPLFYCIGISTHLLHSIGLQLLNTERLLHNHMDA